MSAGELEERPTAREPAALERVTVQALLDPTVKVSGVHARLDRTGVDQRVKVALRLLVPRAPVITADVSLLMDPAVTLKLVLTLLAGIVTLAGTATQVDVEFNDTAVLARTVWDSVTRQEVVSPDIRPPALQDNDEICTGAVKFMLVFPELLL